ncbi:hypothetical protein CULCOIPH002_04140 [Corynebacterium ulcerans]|nr:hypothetical protein CULC0102_0720 [Corynebacterium ulcerans 0102]GJJ32814.1 hypothetical protein CULCOIPH001_00220 [Corynebacterium ulcerans]GJJ35502.1 hypothetical protein CULCOIPH002_04140 [Corynebacterium ulcerans]GJJ39611.1 hypothetical protein CULCOIPH004_00220 [Corynebacterium ulcerans]
MAAMKITIQLKVFSAPIKTVKTRKYGSLQDHDKTSLQSTQPPPLSLTTANPLQIFQLAVKEP